MPGPAPRPLSRRSRARRSRTRLWRTQDIFPRAVLANWPLATRSASTGPSPVRSQKTPGAPIWVTGPPFRSGARTTTISLPRRIRKPSLPTWRCSSRPPPRPPSRFAVPSSGPPIAPRRNRRHPGNRDSPAHGAADRAQRVRSKCPPPLADRHRALLGALLRGPAALGGPRGDPPGRRGPGIECSGSQADRSADASKQLPALPGWGAGFPGIPAASASPPNSAASPPPTTSPRPRRLMEYGPPLQGRRMVKCLDHHKRRKI